ncbi:MAG: hypothetical protein JRJ65_17095 [Deltaproteobacteria bacterium]|nr:hypothetical protein [Deltaproteobacteria bacterium]
MARELTRKMYCLTKKTGFAKDYGPKRQIQDAAGSSMHNIMAMEKSAKRLTLNRTT